MNDTQNGNAKKWEGRWDQLVGKVTATWGAVTNDMIKEANGNYQVLVGKIKEKTGETMEEIENKLERDEN